MANLIAYIPVLNQRHLDWFERHPHSRLFLITQEMAEQFLPRLARNMSAVPTESMIKMIRSLNLVYSVTDFSPGWDSDLDRLILGKRKEWILPDEDISHLVAENYLLPRWYDVTFEMIWARWDMTAVKKAQPVIPDCEVSRRDIDIFRTQEAEDLSRRSPDWWRQIGAIAFRGPELLAFGRNEHFPTEYESYIFGDPRLNFDASDPTGTDAYISLHAEEYLICFCADHGISLRGASLYINTFPCGRCASAVKNAGFKEVFFREGSSFLKGFETLKSAGIRIVQVRSDPESA